MLALGITLGDVTGISPEVALKAVAGPEFAASALVLIGDPGRIRQAAAWAGIRCPIPVWPGHRPTKAGLWQLNPPGSEVPETLTAGAPAAARASLEWLRVGARLSLARGLDGLVTAPVNKEAILRTGTSFVGQTEFLTELAGGPPTAMMLLGTDDRGRWLRVALATTHLPLKVVPAALTKEGLIQTIELAARSCEQLGLGRGRVAVCGLNPHAGEGGNVGREEIEIIQPAIAAAAEKGLDVHGPFAADTLFYQGLRGDYDVIVAMYHDQGLAPLKLVAFETGVNWTVGLPFVRTSPDHGTAYDIAGTNSANPASMRAAIRLALQLAGRGRQRCPEESLGQRAGDRHSAGHGT